MIFELTAAIKTLKREGFKSFFAKLRIYLRDMFAGLIFFLRKQPSGLKTGDLVDYSFHSNFGLIHPSQARGEIIALLELLQKKKLQTVVEIGTANGGTLFLFSQIADPRATVISIDLPNGIHGGGYPYWKTYLYKRFTGKGRETYLIRANSSDPNTVNQLRACLGQATIDFLFIDGDHTYEGVKKDFENYSPLVSKGGVVAFHDICKHSPDVNCHVDDFWKEISPQFRHVEFIEVPDKGWGGIGVLHFPEN